MYMLLAMGLIVGSFLNVALYRWPRELSVVAPRSHCPHCGTTLAWYDLIPVLSYLLLRGHCRYCQVPIARHYLWLELSNAALWYWVAALEPLGLSYPFSWQLCSKLLFTSALLLIAVIDWETFIIPDPLNLFIAGLALPGAFLEHTLLWHERLRGAAWGGGILWGIAYIFRRLRHREGIGGGDIKMMFACGLLLGSKKILTALTLAPYIALAMVGLWWLRGSKPNLKQPIPFGPALALSTFLAASYSEELGQWFWALLL
ncbi:MAG: prepilin peptidase [Symbiobacteriaceae bacterium]|nr:prepilin peptidase [Symbiobacteriaceae bacterium]